MRPLNLVSNAIPTHSKSVKTQPAFSSPEISETPSHPVNIVRDRVDSVRFGAVQIVIHEGRVTQADSTELTRIPPANASRLRSRPGGNHLALPPHYRLRG